MIYIGKQTVPHVVYGGTLDTSHMTRRKVELTITFPEKTGQLLPVEVQFYRDLQINPVSKIFEVEFGDGVKEKDVLMRVHRVHSYQPQGQRKRTFLVQLIGPQVLPVREVQLKIGNSTTGYTIHAKEVV